MNKIVFSQTNIEKLISSNELNIDNLIAQFERGELISATRYIDSAGLPWGSWKFVVEALDKFLLDSNWQFIPKNLVFNVNVAYFAPSSFIKASIEDILKILKQCSQQQLNFILVQPKIVSFLLNLFKQNLSRLEQVNLTSLITFLQALTQIQAESKHTEQELCKHFLSLHNLSPNDAIRIFLGKRIQSLQQSSKALDTQGNLKIALLICGQLRGFEYAIPRFEKKFSSLGQVDAYISTWEDVGYTRFNLQNAYRIFDKKTCDFLIEHKDELDFSMFDKKIAKYTSEIYSVESIRNMLSAKLAWCKNISVNLKNHNEYPYNKMSNSEKMYYHNIYWIETLGQEHFTQYDIIIKIRPDYFFKDETAISLKELNSQTILTDTPNYLFQEWGFGLGDQLWIGGSEAMLSILNCHSRDSLSYQYMSKKYPKEPYQGHLNCGLEAWVNGLKIIPQNNSLLKSRLSSVRLISFSEFIQLNFTENQE